MGEYGITLDDIKEPFRNFLKGFEGNVSAGVIAQAWNRLADELEWSDRLRDDIPSERPKIIVICGSSKFVDIMAVCSWLIEKQEKAIVMSLHLLPRWYCMGVDDHIAEVEGVSEDMDELHLQKIDIGDEIFVVNHHDYIGDSTRREIEYAKEREKKIRWFSHDVIGDQVRAIFEGNM